MSLIDRLTAIAARDLDDRTISPGEARDLLALADGGRRALEAADASGLTDATYWVCDLRAALSRAAVSHPQADA